MHTWRLNSSLLSKSHLNRNAQQLLCSRRRTLIYGDTLTIHQAKLRISSVLLPYWSGRDTTHVWRNPFRLQPARTPIPPHSDSVVSDIAPSVSSAAALNVAPEPGAATQTLATGSNARARPTPVCRQPTWTPLSSSTASVVSDVALSVSSAAALSVAPDVLASAVSQAVGQVLQPLMERVE